MNTEQLEDRMGISTAVATNMFELLQPYILEEIERYEDNLVAVIDGIMALAAHLIASVYAGAGDAYESDINEHIDATGEEFKRKIIIFLEYQKEADKEGL